MTSGYAVSDWQSRASELANAARYEAEEVDRDADQDAAGEVKAYWKGVSDAFQYVAGEGAADVLDGMIARLGQR